MPNTNVNNKQRFPRRVPMDRIMSMYNKIRKDNKLLTLTVSALGVCLLAVVILFVCMPDIKAADYDQVTWTEASPGVYEMADLPDGTGSKYKTATIAVSDGATVTINGAGVSKSNVNIVFNYTGTTGTDAAPAKVYVNLNDVNIAQTLDCAAIRFATNGSPVDYIVTVDGTNLITSSCTGAKNPLIAVEATTYKLHKLKNNLTATSAADYVDTVDMSKHVGLILCGESADDSLRLSNGAGSYGALLGSGEVATFAAESKQELDQYINKLNNDAMGDQILISNKNIRDELYAKYGYEELSAGTYYPEYKLVSTEGTSSGKITIGGNSDTGSKPLTLILNNAGIGAAVGGGGNAGTQPDKLKGANVGKITINAGTITFKAMGTAAPVFGSGYLAGAQDIASSYGVHGGIEINGGSLYFNNYQNKFGNQYPVNKEGKRLYEIMASNSDLQDLTLKNDNDPLKLKYTYDPSLSLGVDLDTYTDSKVKDVATVKMADVKITLSPTVSYLYEGKGHGGDTLYFYLPAIQTTTLTITDEFGLGHTNFIVQDEGGNEVAPISSDKTSYDNRKYLLMRDKTYFIYATEIPAGLSIKSVNLSTGGQAAFNPAKGYQIDANAAKIEANVTYSGTIDIVYNDGLLAGDRDNHTVDMPSKDYEYGMDSFPLNGLGTTYKNCPVGGKVEDLIFDKWVYTDKDGKELGNITHIVKSQSVDGNQRKYSDIVQSDGKIYLKAKWKIKVDFVIGNDATYAGNMPVINVEYAYGDDDKVSVTLPNGVPVKDSFAFVGWTLDDGEEMYNFSTGLGAINEIKVSSLTSHKFYANYERTDFCVYIDASALDEQYATLTCLDHRGMDMLVKNSDGSLATVVVDGKSYYYTTGVIKNTNVRVIIKTKHGYKMENTSMKITGSASSDVSTNSQTGECTADILIETQDVYVTTNAIFNPVKYEILFKDGKVPNEVLWGGTKFTFDIEDIASNKTIGDIIREGLGDKSMSDAAIAAYINTIDKNNRFTDFYGFTLPLYAEALGMDKTIASIYAENPSLVYGDMVFTADWKEYDKYTINMNLLERVFNGDGTYMDVTSDELVAVLYYYADGVKKAPVYTEEVIDPVTGEEHIVAYAKAGDKIEIALHRANSKGKPIGEPIASGIKFEELYYQYESKLNESVRADIKDDSKSFVVKDDVKNQTTIEVYMTFSLEKFNIIYWDLRGFDNSLNPTTYTIFDEIEFAPITDGVDWLLVCPDTDDSNNDDVTTEVIYKIKKDGKLVTDGDASKRDYISNLILKPDWSQYAEESYTITIKLGDDSYGTVKIMYPVNSSEFYANDMVLLSVVPNKGYKLVKNSLIYKKNVPATFSGIRNNLLNRRELNEVLIPVIDEANGTYMITMPSSDIEISALFELCQYEIIYSDMPDGVVNNNPDSYNVNSDIELSEPVREGYTFLGWYDMAGNRVTKIIDRTGDLVLIPKFEIIEESVTPDEPEKPGDSQKPDDTNKPGASEDESDNPNNPDSGDNPDVDNKPSDDNGNADKDDDDKDNNNGSTDNGTINNNVTITGRPSNVVSRPLEGTSGTIIKPGTGNQNINQNVGIGNGQIQTGDETNVPKLALICVGAVLVLLILALKKPSDKNDEE